MTEQTYSRIELATEQLESALRLFLDSASYASAITLAGAAEEIFGKMLLRQGKESVLEWKLDQMIIVHSLLKRTHLTKKELSAKENKIRNMLKHLGAEENVIFQADLEESACWILVRACENAARLGIDVCRGQDFNEWFYRNIVGV